MKLSDFLNDFYVPLRLIGKSKRTVKLYNYSIRLFSKHLGRQAELDDLDDLTVSRHLGAMLDDGKSPYSVQKERDQLLAIWRLAARKNLIKEWPEVARVVVPEIVPKAYSQAELKRLFDACSKEKGYICEIPAADWWKALNCVLLDTAERITAVMAAKFTDIYDNSIIFHAENRKGGRKSNICYLRPKTLVAIERIRNPKRKLIFKLDCTMSMLYKRYRKIRERANLDGKPFHIMRATHASFVEAGGGSAQKSLGHDSGKTTKRHYLDPRIVKNDDFTDLLPDV